MKNKKNFLLLLFFLHIYQLSQAASCRSEDPNDSIRKPFYEAWLYTNFADKPLKGYVYQTTDSSLTLVKSIRSQEKQVIPITQISEVAFRRIHNRRICALGGAAIGIVFGGVFGFAEADDQFFSSLDKAVFGAILLLPVGFFVGLGIGRIKKRSVLSGDFQNYRIQRATIQRYTLTRR